MLEDTNSLDGAHMICLGYGMLVQQHFKSEQQPVIGPCCEMKEKLLKVMLIPTCTHCWTEKQHHNQI